MVLFSFSAIIYNEFFFLLPIVIQNGIWNVGTGKTKSFLEVAQDVASDYNVPIIEIDMPEILKDSYQKYTCADISKLKSIIADW